MTEPEDPLSTELLPADIYRIVDGKEVRDTPWTRFVGRAKNMLTSPPCLHDPDRWCAGGEDPDFTLLEHCCPDCGTLLDTEVVWRDDPPLDDEPGHLVAAGAGR